MGNINGFSATIMKRLLLGGTALAALAPSAAFAAQEPGKAPADEVNSSEIIVTAQRRDERIEDVPASINIVSSEALAQSGVVGVADLAKVVPGLQVSTSGAFTQPTLRGIGSYLTGTGLENNVAIYIDGVYLPATVTNALDFVDIENVQVLKGPQGTLYGRNATGGAIIVTTRDPSFEPYVDLKASYGRFNELKLSGVGSVGLTDTVALGISVQNRSSDGYMTNIVTGKDGGKVKRLTVRPKLLFKPSENFTVNLGFEYSKVNDAGGLAWNSYQGNTAAKAIPGAIVASKPYELSNNDANYIKATTYAGTLRMNLELDGGIAVNSATFYRDSTQNLSTDMDGTQFTVVAFHPWRQEQSTFSQDLVISKSGGAVEWLIGGMYYNDDSYLKTFTMVGVGNLYSPTQKTEAIAGYFDLTLHATDKLTLTGGGRYSTEQKHYIRQAFHNAPVNLDAKARFNAFTPRVTARYEVVDGGNFYASYGKGFKSGLFNAGGGGSTPIKPEKIDAFEAGFKYAGDAVRFDAAAFYYKYKDLQTTIYDLTGGGVQRVLNAGRAKIKGFEASLTLSPVENLDIRFAGTYLDAKYTEFSTAQDYCPAVVGGALPVPGSLSCPAGVPTGGNVTTSVNANGQPLLRAPKFSGNAGINYTVPFEGGNVTFAGNLYYSSKLNYSPNGRLFQPSYVLGSANATWVSANEQFSVGLFADNIFNEKIVGGIFSWQVGDLASYRPPATYGVTLGFKLK